MSECECECVCMRSLCRGNAVRMGGGQSVCNLSTNRLPCTNGRRSGPE